jgi:uncharacterized protein YbjT (DUF2867 family)
MEELVRASGIPSLTLRLAPLVGPASPMWLQLSRRPRLPRGGRDLLQPVVEVDVVEVMDRSLTGRAPWQGWHELVGAEVFSLRELMDLASAQGPQPGLGAWEPPLAELREQRPGEPELWQREFGVTAGSVRELAASWAA